MRYEAAKWGMFIATRERGRQVREEIEEKLAELSSGDVLMLNLGGVEGITVSFGAECVAKLIIDRTTGTFTDRGFAIDGWLPATLTAAMELRSFSASELAEKLQLTPQAAQ